jgi:hypothetical protein
VQDLGSAPAIFLAFEDVETGRRTAHAPVIPAKRTSYMPRELHSNLSGHQIHHTTCSLLAIFKSSYS